MELRYAGDDKLFVPVERLDLVQKYSGAGKPPLDKLGGTSWERAKTRVRKAMRDMAEELLKLYAARKAVPGYAFSPDGHWQREFEDAFRVRPDARPGDGDRRHQARHGDRPRRWTGCCAATWGTARPRWPCARRSRP